MIFWIDAQLPPALATCLQDNFDLEVYPLRDIGLRDAEDLEIYSKAKKKNIVIISKDSDFVELVQRLGTPPQLLWVRCGNVTNSHLCKLFSAILPDALLMLKAGESIIEINDKNQ